MSDTPEPENDRIDDLLMTGARPATDVAWRQALFLRTTGVLRRRRWARRAGFAAALVGCYLAGLATMQLGLPSAPPAERPAELSRASGTEGRENPPREPLPVAPSGAAQDSRQLASVPAGVLERWAPAVSEEQPAQLYRRIGDRYLKEEADVQAALRCYTQALENSSAADLASAPEDDFLLMALKDARKKEQRHANDGG
jgi:hypothetical protein